MDLWIYTENFEALGIVDTATSIIWANRYRQCGDFEIYISASAAMLDLLQEDRLVIRPDDEMIGIIEQVKTGTDTEDGDYIIASGRCARSILARRIIWDQTEINGTVENGLRKLITDALIFPAIAARKFDRLLLAPAHGFTETIQAQYTGDNLLEAVENLCATTNYGFKITRQGTKFLLDFYKGTDRTAGQTDNPRVIFSEDYQNLQSTEYTLNKTDYRSVALVAGEGEGDARRRTIVGRSVDQSGLHRREMYVDARDISSNDGEISTSAYMAQLAERGNQSLSEAPIVRSMEGAIEPTMMFEYKKDYFLGDLVTVINKHGIQADTQVLEIVETWDSDGYTVTPTFG